MKRLRNIKIGSKIVLAFIAVIVLVAVMLVASLLGLSSIKKDMMTFYEDEFQIVQVSQMVKTDLKSFAKDLGQMALAAGNIEKLSEADAKTELNVSFVLTV